jgi:hypothetical protein
MTLEEKVPEEFHEFLDIFSEEKAARFPKSRSWDHKIELKDTFTLKSFKMYNLTPATNRTGQIPEGQLGEGLYSTITITYGVTIFLR